MKIVEFEEHNVIYAKDQPEYQPLPAYKDKEGKIVCCWELSDEEIEKIKVTKKMWLQVLTFNQPLQPLYLTVNKEEVLDTNIQWEVIEDLEVLSVHDKTVSLIGYDGVGRKFQAIGDYSCGQVVKVYEIEQLQEEVKPEENENFTQDELSQVMNFLKDKDTISASYLQRHFDKPYKWACAILEKLEKLEIVEEFIGNRERKVLKH